MKKSLILYLFSLTLMGAGGMDNFLLCPSARIMGMGGSYTAVLGGITSVLENPAGLGGERGYMISSMNMMGLNYILAGKSQPYGGNATIAYGFKGTFSPQMMETDASGESLGVFRYLDLTPFFSFEKGLPLDLTYGFTGKLYYRNAEEYHSLGFGMDVGIDKKIKEDDDYSLWGGIAIKDIGYIVKPFIQESEFLPTRIKMGIAYYKENSVVSLTYSPVKEFSFGVEQNFGNLLALRAGYTTMFNDLKQGNPSDLVNGLSMGFSIKTKKLYVDYSVIFLSMVPPLQAFELHF